MLSRVASVELGPIKVRWRHHKPRRRATVRPFARSRRASLLAAAVIPVVLLGAAAPSAVAVPPNDDFADAIPLHLGRTIKGTTFGATREEGEPQHPGYDQSERSVWYRFRSPRRVTVLLSIVNAAGQPTLAVYTGRSVRSLRLIDHNADGRVAFTARAGQTYRIAVADEDDPGLRQWFYLRAKAIGTPPNDDFAYAKWLALGSTTTGTTRNATLELGEPQLVGGGSVWYKLRVVRRARVTLTACPSREEEIGPDLSVYTGRRVNRLTEVANDAWCEVSFTAAAGAVYRIQVFGSGSPGRFKLAARRAKG